MAHPSNALIIGGGIAGLSAAIALSRVGVRCDVVELADEAPPGASVSISGRAAEALDELGVYAECYANGTPFTDSSSLTQMDSAGHVTSAGPGLPQWPGARTAIGIYRPVLLRILADAARGLGVTIRSGVTLVSADERDDGSLVTTSDGEQQCYDLVVGADGIGSTTRSDLFPDAPGPTYSGQISLRWMAPGPPVADQGWYHGPVGRLGFYSLPQDLVYLPAVIDAPDRTHLTDDDVHALFTELLDSYTAPAVVELRRRLTPDAEVICRPFDWILVPDRWHRGRTILIGDAAHATTAHLGQGAGMALEDAVVLAQCVSTSATLSEAFEAFMARRYDRVRTVVETSVALSRLEQEGAAPRENVAVIQTALQTLAQPY